MIKMTITTVVLCLLWACQPDANEVEAERIFWSAPSYYFPYQLDDPATTHKLPKKLREISGLSLSSEGTHLVAVQDEDGELFFINRETGEVDASYEFWKAGDYEGVEATPNAIYALKSSGTLYKINNPGGENQTVDKFNTVLSGENDVEGLCYDQNNNRLLLACKASAGHESIYPLQKGIYGFDLSTEQLDPEPAFLIKLEQIQAYLNMRPEIRKLEKLIEFFQPNDEGLTFSPSGIAIHPTTQNIYVTSSVGKILLVMSPTGNILHLEKLKKKVHTQPEGICFAPDGTLYISNEGKGDKARLYSFKMKNQ
jgi:uncharacterized protein YjiK